LCPGKTAHRQHFLNLNVRFRPCFARYVLMKTVFLAALTALGALVARTDAQTVTWDRKAFGQEFPYPCGGGNYSWENTNNWTRFESDPFGEPCHVHYEAQPSNWDTANYPNGSTIDVVLGDSGGKAGGAPTNLDRGAPISVHSVTILPTGGLTAEFGASLTMALLNIQAAGTLAVGGGGGQAPLFIITSGGTLQKTAGVGTYTFDPGFLTLEVPGGGTIACTSGTLFLPGNVTTYVGPVSFNASTGALIDLAPPGAVDAGVVRMIGSMTSTNGGGTVRLSGGWLSTVTDTGGATLNFGGDTFQWTGGSFRSQAADPFVNAGTINITGAASLLGVGFKNDGTVAQSGPGSFNMPYGCGFTNEASGTFDFRTDNGIIVDGGGGAGPFFKNSGTIRKSAGTGTTLISKDVNVDNIHGTIQVDTGTLVLGHGLTTGNGTGDGGTFVVAPGATLSLTDGTGDAGYNGTYTGSGGGTVTLLGGFIVADTSRAGFTFNLPDGMFQWAGGTIATNANAPFINAGHISLVGPVALGGIGFTNQGTVTQSGAGSLNVGYGGGFTNTAGAFFDIQNDVSLTNNGGGGAGPFFNNAGTLEKSAGAGTNTIPQDVTNSGTVRVNSGTLRFEGSYLQTGGTTDLNGGNISSLKDIVLDGGSVVGTGTVDATIRNNGGIVGPGHSPGKLTINGNYIQGADGSLNIEIGGNTPGTGYDQLVVNGAAAVGGTLNIVAINGFTPKAGDQYTLISAANLSGSFATVNISGFTGRVDVSSSGITVSVLTSSRQLLNISTRMEVLTDQNVLIGGFIVTGSEAKKVLIRGLGPELPVANQLQDPVLELHQGTTVIAQNDDWRATQEQEIKDTTIPPTDDRESSIVQTLEPGKYTAVLSGKGGATGVGQVEVYDLSAATASQVANISTRGFVDVGDNVMIGGVIIGAGSEGTSATVLVRAIGPSLSDQGIGNALQDPMLELRDANAQLVAQNDDWRQTQEQAINDTTVAPTDDRESAIVQTLGAGNYTAIVRGKDNSTGVGLVELYNLQ
jgi:hypothetical protein